MRNCYPHSFKKVVILVAEIRKEDYMVTAQDRIQFAQYELLIEIRDALQAQGRKNVGGRPKKVIEVDAETAKGISETKDNNKLLQTMKPLFEDIVEEVKNDDKVRNKGRSKKVNK